MKSRSPFPVPARSALPKCSHRRSAAIPPMRPAAREGGRGIPESWPAIQGLDATEIVDLVLPHAPGLTARLERGINLLQPQCRDPIALLELAGRFPRSRFAGTSGALADITWGRIMARKYGLQNFWMTQVAPRASAYGPFFDAALWLGREDQIIDQPAFAAVSAQLKPAGLLLLTLPGAGWDKVPGLLEAGGLVPTRHASLPSGRGCLSVARR
jgi:hypothetical protein